MYFDHVSLSSKSTPPLRIQLYVLSHSSPSFILSKNKTKNENQIKFNKTRQNKTKTHQIKQKKPSQKIPNPMDSVLC